MVLWIKRNFSRKKTDCFLSPRVGLVNVDITVSTSKLKETKQFYTTYLKFEVVKETPGFLSLSPGPGMYRNMMLLLMSLDHTKDVQLSSFLILVIIRWLLLLPPLVWRPQINSCQSFEGDQNLSLSLRRWVMFGVTPSILSRTSSQETVPLVTTCTRKAREIV